MDNSITSDWQGTEIIYVEGEGYKIVIDMGTFQYVLNTPKNITLSDLSDYSDSRKNPKPSDEMEEIARGQNDITVFTKEKYDKGYYGSDNLIEIPMDVFALEADFLTTAENFLGSIDAIKEESTNKLYFDPEYIEELGGYYILAGGDMKTAVANFHASKTYGDILRRLQLTEAEVKAFTTKDTNPEQYEKNYDLYYRMFKRHAVKNYGSPLPENVVKYLADKTRSGYFSEAEAIEQIQGIFDPYAGIDLNKRIIGLLEGEDIMYSTDQEKEAQDLLNTYLPDHLHGEYDVATIAGNMRNNAQYKNRFIEELKDKRFAFYDMYDRDVNWSSIISAKQTLATNVLGVNLDTSDPLLDELVKMNDYSKESQRLREYGLQTGNQKVKNDLASAMFNTFGSGLAPNRSYVG